MFGMYPFWDDIRVIIVISSIFSGIYFSIIKLITDNFKCANWFIFMPTYISIIGIIISFIAMLFFEGKSGIVQHVFLCVLSYSVCIAVVTVLIGVIIVLVKYIINH